MGFPAEMILTPLSQRKRSMWVFLACVLIPAVLGFFIFYEGISSMVNQWLGNETYSHGIFVPFISLYLIYKRREQLRELPIKNPWWGFLVVLLGLGLYFIGEFSTLYIVIQVALWVVLVGFFLSAIGTRRIRVLAFPLLYLIAMIPLPNFLYGSLSGWLQLVSSKLGVGCLQFVGVMAFREGNIIDLGPIQLQVVEACDGLRYLFPLSALALILAYLFKDKMWKRVFLFLSSLPISVFLNGFRIGMTGMLVDFYGQEMAEGFFHSFSGWIIFMASLLLLVGEMKVLSWIGKGRKWRPIGDLLAQDSKKEISENQSQKGPIPFAPAYFFSVALLIPALMASMHIETREENPPKHLEFSSFPLALDGWKGTPNTMEPRFIDALKFDDYLQVDYRNTEGSYVNLYSAYYRSQKKGASIHSPKSCIPGGGWEIKSIRDREITLPDSTASVLKTKQVVIQKGETKQMVFYWFAGRDRILTNEYRVKLYLVWDAITKNRTDGALVRLVTPLLSGESEADAEVRLVRFARTFNPVLRDYIPD